LLETVEIESDSFMKLSDIGSSVLLALLGGLTAWQAQKLSLGVVRAPGPGFFPFCLGLLLIGAALVIFTQGLKREPAGRQGGQGKGRVYAALAALFIYAFVLEPLGYVLTTFLLLYFLLTMLTRKKWWYGPLVACLFTVVSYVIFGIWLKILLPKGILVL